MASSALRRSLPRRLLTSDPSSAAASFFRRSFLSGEGAGESADDFEKRLFESDDKSFFGKLDGVGSSFGRRHGTGSGMGAFSQQGEMGNLFGGRSSHGIMDGFDSLNDGMNEKLDDAARTFHMTDEVEDDDYDFRPDVNYKRGSTYNVRDLDLTRPAAPRNPPRPQFETATKEVLRKADFRHRSAKNQLVATSESFAVAWTRRPAGAGCG
nr:uncharacterized protein LOC109737945 isoform X2 [Aegilops tauschii subsp. strangulata]